MPGGVRLWVGYDAVMRRKLILNIVLTLGVLWFGWMSFSSDATDRIRPLQYLGGSACVVAVAYLWYRFWRGTSANGR